MKTNLLEDVLRLPVPERVKLADEIYRSIDQEADDVGILPAILAEMERRDDEYEANPASGCTIDALEKKLFKKK